MSGIKMSDVIALASATLTVKSVEFKTSLAIYGQAYDVKKSNRVLTKNFHKNVFRRKPHVRQSIVRVVWF